VMLDAAVTELLPLVEDGWSAASISEAMERAAVKAGITKEDGSPQMAKASGPVRVAVTGRRVGPPLWESLEALGAERTLVRLGAARSRLASEPEPG
jgi:glutamyl-tRNA synthetase